MTMEKISGNYLTQANRDFPMDCETLEYQQQLVALVAVIGNVAGDRVVLSGCEANAEGTRRSAGYVFVRTKDFPEGEVLPWAGGPVGGGMYLKQEDISVSANNVDYPKAYTRRSLAPGIGVENFSWDDFTEIRNIMELMAENRELRGEIAELQPAPLGIVQMWAGVSVPEGYVLCDGREYSITEYPELSKALGTTFNTATNANGGAYTTTAGYFRVPDLRGRFVVGRHDDDNEYKELGAAGGKKSVALTTEQLPEHKHDVKDYLMINPDYNELSFDGWKWVDDTPIEVGGDMVSGPKRHASAGKSTNKYAQWLKHGSEMAGGGEAHENRPPYYVLAYIIRAK